MVKKSISRLETHVERDQHKGLDDDSRNLSTNEDDMAGSSTLGDDVTAHNQEEGKEIIVKFEYHVVYSTSYEVPVLYFKAAKEGWFLELT